MNKQLLQIQTLMLAMEQEVKLTPEIPLDIEIIKLRHRLVEEENNEILDWALQGHAAREAGDMELYHKCLGEVGDGLTDTSVVLYGGYHAYGFGQDNLAVDMFEEVQASNMSKLDENGKPIKREDGKFLKGPNYFKPNLWKIISAYLFAKKPLPIMSDQDAEREFPPLKVQN